ncbi:heavy-metal-associated domain-containing protein [Aquincola sp. J276]|uniref:heavy-metal-associated domain-containing protein n=1 Tax=Aquincola sp. J276 TaxID=2898432 RepID=UPI0021506D7C|nr:heavy-metal-associated domain-containing protein [Aquincola sp. J276]MCR5867597.1 heavy-metal-associated domain-containing protein [Aquincola sp. J276]
MKFTPLLMAGLIASAGAMSAGFCTVTLDLTKMDCAVCPITVLTALKRVPGAETATADFKTRRAVVASDPAKTSPEALTRATADAGFPWSMTQAQ